MTFGAFAFSRNQKDWKRQFMKTTKAKVSKSFRILIYKSNTSPKLHRTKKQRKVRRISEAATAEERNE